MFYHISLSQNKESILEKGLISNNGVVYLAKSIYDAFLLAPPMDSYYTEYGFIEQTIKHKFLYDWDYKENSISLFQVDINENAAFRQESSMLSYYLKMLGLPTCETDKMLYEYLIDHVPTQNIKHIQDIVLPIPQITKSFPDRWIEYLDLILKDNLAVDIAVNILNVKYNTTFNKFVPIGESCTRMQNKFESGTRARGQ